MSATCSGFAFWTLEVEGLGKDSTDDILDDPHNLG